MAEDLRAARLIARGWTPPRDHLDICYLDCAEPGFTKVVRGSEICLCVDDAMVLENGSWGEDYAGAPLPPASRATRWPWRPLEQAVAS